MNRFAILAVTCLVTCVLPACADTSVVFNEIMYHPATNEPAMEWVELYNQMAVDVDISDWSLDGEIDYRFGANTVLKGGAFLVVALSPADLAAATGLTNILGPFTKRLSNSGGELRLRNNNGRVVNKVDYGTSGDWPVAPDGAGASLAKLDHSTTSDAPENWAASAQMGGTPGRENFPTQPALVPIVFNEIGASTNSDFWLELMNYGTSTLELAGYAIVHDGATDSECVLPAGTTLPGGSFLVLSNTVLGFHPVAGDRLYLLPPLRTNVLDAVKVEVAARGRWPDGTGTWLSPTALTPGASNSFVFHGELVINEIMYHHQLLPTTNGLVPGQPSSEGWIELYNRSTGTVDLTGWKLEGGIHYSFPAGKTIAPDAYLVVANDRTGLQTYYPTIDIIGNYAGKLSHHSDTIVLLDPAGNPADRVRYYDDGRWPAAADGGGSSLELMDPDADNAQPGAWAASDESGKTSWQTYSYQAVAQTRVGTDQWNDFILGLLDAGECLVDDLSVVQSPASNPRQFIANGNFENGATGWRFLGNHMQSQVEPEPGNPANHVLHVVASGVQGDQHDHIETTYKDGRRVTDGLTYQISFRAKWLSGNDLLNTRLYYNRVARTTVLPVPALNGTPGAQNSRYATNIGPTFSRLQHQAAVPQANKPVTVSVVAQDPEGVSTCEVWWSAHGGAFSHAAMTAQTAGLYKGTIPGFAAGTIVQFYVRAVDSLGAVSTYPAAGPNSGALYMVADGQANFSQGHNLRVILSPSNWSLLRADTNLLGQANLPCTVIYDEQRPYYELLVRLKGSPLGRVNDPYPSFHLKFQPDDLFRGVHSHMLVDTSGRANGVNPAEQIIVNHMNLHAGGIPEIQPDLCRVIPPYGTNSTTAVLLPRFEDEFLATAYPEGDNGALFGMEIDYYPTTTNAAGYKLPTPQSLWGDFDIQDLGDDKETYRYNFVIQNHRSLDDYSRLIPFCKVLWLSNTPILEAQSRLVMDVDQWLRVFAMISLLGEGDWYTFGWPHNILLYIRPDNNRLLAFPYDVEQLFIRSATAPLIGNPSTWTDLQQEFPGNRRRLYAHALDIINSTFNVGYMAYWTAHYGNMCGQNFSDLLSWIPNRTAAVLAEINGAGGASPFDVRGTNFITTADNLITLTGTAPVQVQSLLINGIPYPVTWISVSEWTLSVPVSSPTNVLTILGCDLYGNTLTNYTASITVNYTGSASDPVGALAINEIMYNALLPGASYIELFNTSASTSFDLSNWRLDGLGYTFPPGAFLTPNQFLLLVKDQSAFINAYGPTLPAFDLFAGNLATAGETLSLVSPGSPTVPPFVVDKVKYSAVSPWPPTSPGVSLQLIDPAQDHFRVGNWSSALSDTADGQQWVYFSATGTATSSILYIYLQAAGDAYLDDLKLVAGSVPDLGTNVLADGDFESGFPGPWIVSTNLTGSELSTEVKHSGAASLHVVASSGGSSWYSAIRQTISPALVTNAPYTLSFWYLQSTNPGVPVLTVRLSGRGIEANVNPASGAPVATPGASNTMQRALTPFPPLWINELQADNLTGITNGAGQRVPWLELYNPSTNTILLTDLYLSGNYTNLTAWAFPTGSVIYPGQFKLIFADGQTNLSTTNELHAGFTLASSTGSVALSRFADSQLQVLDYVDYTNLTPNRSYGSFPDGQNFDRQEFTYVTPGGNNNNSSPWLSVVINEWMAANTRTLPNPLSGKYSDWFELYNCGSNPVNLAGYFLTDDLANPFQFEIPAGYIIPPQGFLLVWADGRNTNGTADLHVTFKLDKYGESLGLFGGDGNPVDFVNYGVQAADVSQGRYPDGANTFFSMPTATPRTGNVIPNTAPVLVPQGDRLLHAGQRISFTASATDQESPPQALSFSLDPGAPAGASLNPVTGAFTWVTTNVPVPGTNSITLRVTDDGTPPLSAANTFVVTVLPLPQLRAARPVGAILLLSFASLLGQTYQVQYTTNLADPYWTPLTAPLPGNGGTLDVEVDMASLPQCFYRLLVQP